MKKSLSTLLLVLGGLFLFPTFAQAQFITDSSVLFQLQSSSYSDVLNGTSQWTARIGNGWSASTTGFNLFASTTIINATAQNFRVDIQGYTNSGYTGSPVTCAYDSQNLIPVGFYEGIIRVDNFFTGGIANCNLKPNLFYKIALSFGTPSNAISQLKGVNQSVAPFDVELNDINLGVPFIMMKATLSSLDPNLINGGNPSGIGTSTIQSYCNSSFSTSTGLFSDFANGVTYGFCTALSFLFVPNQNSLQNFSNLSLTAQEKIPFSYFYQIKDVFSTGSSTGANFVAVEFDISSTSVCSTAIGCILPSVDAFSTSTVSEYIGPSTLALLRFLMSMVIWLSFAYYVYGVVTRLLAHTL